MDYKIIKYSEINPDKLREVFMSLSFKYLRDESIIKNQTNKSRIEEEIQQLLPAYPNISIWYKKIIDEINKDPNSREMFIALSSEKNSLSIAGLMILKNHPTEKKICTLRVKDSYRGKGIGSKLFNFAFEYLNTRKPLITVPEESRDTFIKIFKKYKFKETERYIGLYREGKIEYIYNGNFK